MSKFPGLTLTALNDKSLPPDLLVTSSQAEGDASPERPQQKDKKQCSCSCSCKKNTEDTPGAALEAEKKPFNKSLAMKLKDLGTTVTGHGHFSDLPSWIFSSTYNSI